MTNHVSSLPTKTFKSNADAIHSQHLQSIGMNVYRRLLTWMFEIQPRHLMKKLQQFQIADASVLNRYEQIIEAFLRGYRLGLQDRAHEDVCAILDELPSDLQGFAYEGAAMGMAILDIMLGTNWSRCRVFLNTSGAKHLYVIYIGIGWAIGVALPLGRWRLSQVTRNLDPLLRSLVVDGYGFHHGFVGGTEYIARQARRLSATSYYLRAFDQGLGRSLWFVKGADVIEIGTQISQFPEARRGDLWSGVGLACTYTSCASLEGLRKLKHVAGEYQRDVALGAAFAAKAMVLAGTENSHTHQACTILCGLSANDAAELTDSSLRMTSHTPRERWYEAWRQATRNAIGFTPVAPALCHSKTTSH